MRGTLADIRQRCREAGIVSQAMIVASPTLGASQWETLARSKLYDPGFTHRFRRASTPASPAPAAAGHDVPPAESAPAIFSASSAASVPPTEHSGT